MWKVLYAVVLWLARPYVRLRLMWRARSEPEYGRRVPERYGHVPRDISPGAVWFHAVSAGETIASAPLVEALTTEFPHTPFLVTTMTPTGSAAVERLLGRRVHHCYAPYDFPDALRRFFDRVRPRMLVLVETELWPNMLTEAARRQVPVVCINARLSERSARGYARAGELTQRMLGQLSHIACQYPQHAQRFIDLGAPEDRVSVCGNVKFDVTVPDGVGDSARVLLDRWLLDDRPVWIAASTHDGEETLALEAHVAVRARYPNACLLLVPRHPARADAIWALLNETAAEHGWSLIRYSGDQAHGTAADVVLVDAMGLLMQMYAVSAVAFVGGSFAPVGGHNPIEPALFGLPIVTGPHRHNFTEIFAAFEQAGVASTIAADAADEDAGSALGDAIIARLDVVLTPDQRVTELRRAAHAVIDTHRGARGRLLRLLRGWIVAR